MDEKSFKKIGEAIAFARVCEDVLVKARKPLTEATSLGSPWYEAVLGETIDTRKALDGWVESQKEGELDRISEQKALKTVAKIESMQSIYISEEDFNDISEVVEWMGILFGGAYIHWAVVAGLKNPEVSQIGTHGVGHYLGVLEKLADYAQGEN